MSRLSFLHTYALLLVPVAMGAFALWGRRLGGVLTLAVVVLLCVAVARPQWTATTRRVARIYALDSSGSVFLDVPKALAAVRRSMASLAVGDRAGLVVFGASAGVVLPPTAPGGLPLNLEVPPQIVRGDGTDIAEAIRTSVQQLADAGYDRQLVVISDGRETGGDAELEAAVAADAGVRVFVVPVGPEDVRDARVALLRVPARVPVGEPFEIEVVVAATAPMEVTLSVARDGLLVGEVRSLSVESGIPRRVAIRDRLDTPGSFIYTASLSVADRCAENNTRQAVVCAEGATSVLYIGPANAQLAQFLAGVPGLSVRRLGPPDFRSVGSFLPVADCLVLDGVGADEFSAAGLRAIRDWVRDAGGGLVALGGPASYGPGGYAGTAVEEALPVLCSRPQQVALLVALDCSGSMADAVGGRPKIGYAREAVLRCAGRLRKTDSFGLMVFAGEPQVRLQLGPVPTEERLAKVLDGVEPHGPTELDAALERALAILSPVAAQVRHIILVSDGQVTDDQAKRIRTSDFKERMARRGVTLSALMTGQDAKAAALLGELAGASFHLVKDPANLPAVFLDELRKATYGDLIRLGETIVRPVGAPEVAKGIAPGRLAGYVRTFAKPGAVAEWVTGEPPDPVLARWQFGLGRSVAFASTVGSQWDASLWGADGFSRLWPQVVRWAARPPRSPGFEAEAAEQGDQVVLTARAEHDGRAVNGLELVAHIAPPAGNAFDIPLVQTAPGEYQGAFRADIRGPYLATVIEKGGERRVSLSIVRNYSREWESFGVNRPALEAIARAGRGQVLASLDDLRGVEPAATAGSVEITWLFLTGALVLFVAEVARHAIRARRERL